MIVLKSLSAANEVTVIKIEERNQKQKVTPKDPKKVEAVKRLTEYNRRKKEKLAHLAKAQSETKLTSSQHYSTGIVVAIGGAIAFTKFKKTPKETPVHQTIETTVN